MLAETITMQGHKGDAINAYVARPLGAGPHPGMFHPPRAGWDEWYRECTRRFAHHGYVAISPNLYFPRRPWHTGRCRRQSQSRRSIPDEQVLGDLDGANKLLRSLPYVIGKVGVIRHLLRRPSWLSRRLPIEKFRRIGRVLGRSRGSIERRSHAQQPWLRSIIRKICPAQ